MCPARPPTFSSTAYNGQHRDMVFPSHPQPWPLHRRRLFSDPCCWRPVPTRTWATIAAPMPASLGGHVGVARLLLDAGADRNLANSNGDTALKLASVGGHVGVARLLLDDGPYIVNSYGDTTLMAASATGHVEVAPLLYGDTALMAASAKGNVEVARLLLDAGADSNLANSHGRTALNLAFVGGHVQVKRLLLEASTGKNSINKRHHGFSNRNPKGQR